jgi:hypothetical protein
VFVAFDENQNKVLEYFGNVTDDGSTRDKRGMFEVTITENDLLNIRQQYLHYNIYIEENLEERTLTYSSRSFDSAGTIYIDGKSFPGPKLSTTVTTFYPVGEFWMAGNTDADSIFAQPGLNGNDALHTVAVYTTGYIGTVKIQATLENQISGQNNWSDIQTLEFVGTETEPTVANFNGVYRFLRFVIDSDPADKIVKILVRN